MDKSSFYDLGFITTIMIGMRFIDLYTPPSIASWARPVFGIGLFIILIFGQDIMFREHVNSYQSYPVILYPSRRKLNLYTMSDKYFQTEIASNGLRTTYLPLPNVWGTIIKYRGKINRHWGIAHRGDWNDRVWRERGETTLAGVQIMHPNTERVLILKETKEVHFTKSIDGTEEEIPIFDLLFASRDAASHEMINELPRDLEEAQMVIDGLNTKIAKLERETGGERTGRLTAESREVEASYTMAAILEKVKDALTQGYLLLIQYWQIHGGLEKALKAFTQKENRTDKYMKMAIPLLFVAFIVYLFIQNPSILAGLQYRLATDFNAQLAFGAILIGGFAIIYLVGRRLHWWRR